MARRYRVVRRIIDGLRRWMPCRQPIRHFAGSRQGYLAVASLLLLAGSLLLPAAGYADEQSTLSIKSMKISVWPEYDDPRVLVIYEGEFAGDANFSKEVKFRIPKGAEINQVCALQKPNDDHLCQLYEVSQDGESLSYTLPIPTFFLEFYYQPLQGQSDKKMDYSFESFYPVDKLQVEVQQPLRTSNFDLSPKAAGMVSDRSGFNYYQYQFDNVAATQPIKLSASYTKADDRPSIEKAKSGGTSSTNDLNLPLLGVFGAGLLALVAYYAITRRHARPLPATVRQLSSARVQAPPATGGGRGPAGRSGRVAGTGGGAAVAEAATRIFFCTNCGAQIEAEDNFCPNCGQKTRKPI